MRSKVIFRNFDDMTKLKPTSIGETSSHCSRETKNQSLIRIYNERQYIINDNIVNSEVREPQHDTLRVFGFDRLFFFFAILSCLSFVISLNLSQSWHPYLFLVYYYNFGVILP